MEEFSTEPVGGACCVVEPPFTSSRLSKSPILAELNTAAIANKRPEIAAIVPPMFFCPALFCRSSDNVAPKNLNGLCLPVLEITQARREVGPARLRLRPLLIHHLRSYPSGCRAGNEALRRLAVMP